MGDERKETAASAAAEAPGTAGPVLGSADTASTGAGQAAAGTGEGAADGLVRAEEAVKALTPTDRCRISLLRNVRYHEDREAHFAWVNKALDLFTLVSGLGTVIALSDLLPHGFQVDGRWIAALTSVVGAVQLVFGLTRREALHSDLRRRFLALLVELDDDTVKQIDGRMKALYGDEPPTFHAVDALAYNAAQSALDRPKGTLRVVSGWQKAMRNWRRFEGVRFPEKGDMKAKA